MRPVQVAQLRAARASFEPPPRFTEVVDLIKTGHFGWQDYFAPLMDTLETTDHYLVANDFQGYIDIQARCRAPAHPAMLSLPHGLPHAWADVTSQRKASSRLAQCALPCVAGGASLQLWVRSALASQPSRRLWGAVVVQEQRLLCVRGCVGDR